MAILKAFIIFITRTVISVIKSIKQIDPIFIRSNWKLLVEETKIILSTATFEETDSKSETFVQYSLSLLHHVYEAIFAICFKFASGALI